MKRAIACVAFIGLAGIASAEQAPVRGPAPVFTPRLDLNSTPAPAFYRPPPPRAHKEAATQPRRHDSARGQTEIICGLTVIRKSPDFDRGILVPPKDRTRSAIRRLIPPVCTSPR